MGQLKTTQASQVLEHDGLPVRELVGIGGGRIVSIDWNESDVSSRLRLWSTADGALLEEVQWDWRPPQYLVAVAQRYLLGAWDERIEMWDVEEGRPAELDVSQLDGSINGIWAVDDKGLHVAVWSHDTVTVLSVEERGAIATRQMHIGKQIHRLGSAELVLPARDAVTIWNWKRDHVRLSVETSDQVRGLRRCHRWNEEVLVGLTTSSGLWVWHLGDDAILLDYRDKGERIEDFLRFDDFLITVGRNRSRDEDSGSLTNKQLRLWSTQPWEDTGYLEEGHGPRIDGRIEEIEGRRPRLAKLDDEHFVVWNRRGERALSKWSWPQRKRLAVTNLPTPSSPSDETELLVFPSDHLAVSYDGTEAIDVWNLETMEHHVSLVGHQGPVHGVEALDNGRLLSWSEDGTVLIWEVEGLAEGGGASSSHSASRGAIQTTVVERAVEEGGNIVNGADSEDSFDNDWGSP